MKTAYTLLGLTLGIALNTQAQNVGINTDGSTPDTDAILHINNHSGSGKDSSVVRIENEQNGVNDVTGVEIYNSGTGVTAKWDVYIPASGSTDLRIKNNGTDRITIQNDGDVGIGTTSPVSGLDIQSSMGYKVNTITSATTLDNTHNVVLCNTGPYTVTLPAAASNTGRVYYIKNDDVDGDVITIDGNASETINGSATYSLESYNHVVQIISNGTNWHVIEEANNNVGTISAINCGSATHYGDLTDGEAASGVSSSIPYTCGNSGDHDGQTVASTGVTGLTATLSAGSFACGADSVVYNITGTPTSEGTASFAIDIGGQTCSLTRTVTSSGVPNTCNPANTTAIVDVVSTTGKTWMDRNLGATRAATSSTDAQSYGSLYQWGRGSDGHQCVNRYAGDGVTTSSENVNNSSTDTPGHGDFITEGISPYDWRSPQNNSLWQGVNGINNPCPSGYRLPTDAEWEAERNNGGTGFWGTGTLQNNAAGAYSSVLKLPMAGNRLRSNGSLSTVGASGNYWSSTVSGTSARYLNFSSSSASMGTGGRASGLSVRCLKD